MTYIIKKHLYNYEIFFSLEQNQGAIKTNFFCEQQLRNHFQKRVEEWKKTLPQSKILVCKICLKKFKSEDPDLMLFHSLKCKEKAELNQLLQQQLKKIAKVKTECDLIKSQLQFETHLEKYYI